MQSQHSLELRQRQHLALTPELQQSIRFLQLSAMELQQELAQAVLDNPLLESEPEYDIDDPPLVETGQPALTADWAGSGRRGTGDGDDESDEWQGLAAPETLHDHLSRQLGMLRVDDRVAALVRVLVHELDEDGYLTASPEELVACLQQYAPVDLPDLQDALRALQFLEPAGIGARSLQECLQLQLERRDSDAVVECAQRIVGDHLELLATGSMQRLQQALGCDAAIVKQAHSLILSLEPRPARDWTGSVAHYVVPDVFVRKQRRGWRVMLNPAVVPRVRVHSLYSEWIGKAGPDAAALRDKLQQAHGTVRSLHQRCDTILRVSQAIMTHQQDYLDHGPAHMRPLVLRDIAVALGIHESTVSRATRYKYAQTPHGVIELRAFFGSTLETADGESTSASAVQFMIARLIGDEPRSKPLSDNKISQLLEQQGIKVARRTVAKYREAAGIEPAIRRKARYAMQL